MWSSLKIPLSIDFDRTPVLDRETISIEESIDQSIDLIVFTPKGSFSADPDFGFEYWNHEFANINVQEFNNNYLGLMSNDKQPNDISRFKCEESLKNSILTYEPLLLNPAVKIELNVAEKNRRNRRMSKYTIRILVTGEIDQGFGVTRKYEKRISFMVEPTAHKISI